MKSVITRVDLQLLFTIEIEVQIFEARHQAEMSETTTTSTVAGMIIAEENRVRVRLAENPRFRGADFGLNRAGDVEVGGGWGHHSTGYFQHSPPVHQSMRLGSTRTASWLGCTAGLLESDNN